MALAAKSLSASEVVVIVSVGLVDDVWLEGASVIPSYEALIVNVVGVPVEFCGLDEVDRWEVVFVACTVVALRGVEDREAPLGASIVVFVAEEGKRRPPSINNNGPTLSRTG